MRGFLFAVLFLVIGAIVGGLLALSIGAGIGAGAGIVTGLKAGACGVVVAAKNQGLMTSEQVDDILKKASFTIAGNTALPPEAKLAGGEAECEKFIAELRESIRN